MLPKPKSADFPKALKAAREAKDLSWSQLAVLCDISSVMPARYENKDSANFCKPSEKTWNRLNKALFGVDATVSPGSHIGRLVSDASVDELVEALKDRGAVKVNLTF